MDRPIEIIEIVRRNREGDILNVHTSGEREIGHQEAIFELKKGTISDPEHKLGDLPQ
ncbi:hypothetical protein ACFOU2_17660 [Bacillus songklensis]|uniref:Uncharacterized protein n=1 Tax=Bacillus songklensis TaxID=1069116 RepID=A0ABV8B4M3_9BACI